MEELLLEVKQNQNDRKNSLIYKYNSIAMRNKNQKHITEDKKKIRKLKYGYVFAIAIIILIFFLVYKTYYSNIFDSLKKSRSDYLNQTVELIEGTLDASKEMAVENYLRGIADLTKAEFEHYDSILTNQTTKNQDFVIKKLFDFVCKRNVTVYGKQTDGYNIINNFYNDTIKLFIHPRTEVNTDTVIIFHKNMQAYDDSAKIYIDSLVKRTNRIVNSLNKRGPLYYSFPDVNEDLKCGKNYKEKVGYIISYKSENFDTVLFWPSLYLNNIDSVYMFEIKNLYISACEKSLKKVNAKMENNKVGYFYIIDTLGQIIFHSYMTPDQNVYWVNDPINTNLYMIKDMINSAKSNKDSIQKVNYYWFNPHLIWQKDSIKDILPKKYLNKMDDSITISKLKNKIIQFNKFGTSNKEVHFKYYKGMHWILCSGYNDKALDNYITNENKVQFSLFITFIALLFAIYFDYRRRKLSITEKKLRIMAENTDNCVFIINPKYQIEYANKGGLKKIYGFDNLEEFIDKKGEDIRNVSVLENNIIQNYLDQIKGKKEPGIDYENTIENKVGERIEVKTNLVASFKKDKLEYYYTIDTNISELKKEKKKAEDAFNALDKIFTGINHDYKGPINRINEITKSIINDNPNNTPLIKDINVITANSNVLLYLIDNILLRSSIKEDMFRIVASQTNLVDVIAEIENNFRILVEKKGVIFNIHKPELPESLTIDKTIIFQILMNLIGNAYKFTENGKIEFIIEGINQSETKIDLIFIVKDTAKPIPEEELEQIWNPYTKGGENAKSGIGLGLSIVKQLVEMMDGNYKGENRKKEGNKFTVTLPNIDIINNTPTYFQQNKSNLLFPIDDKFSKIPDNLKLDEFFKQDMKDLLEIWELKHLHIAFNVLKVNEFSKLIIEIGEKHHYEVLKEYGEKMHIIKPDDIDSHRYLAKHFDRAYKIIIEQIKSL